MTAQKLNDAVLIACLVVALGDFPAVMVVAVVLNHHLIVGDLYFVETCFLDQLRVREKFINLQT